MRLLDHHIQQNHAAPVHVGDGQQQVRPEKIQRPKLVVKEGFVTDEAFDYFEHAWGEYKTLASVLLLRSSIFLRVWGKRYRRWSITRMGRRVTML